MGGPELAGHALRAGLVDELHLIITPVILLYEAWTYHVFRARVTGEELAVAPDLVPRES